MHWDLGKVAVATGKPAGSRQLRGSGPPMAQRFAVHHPARPSQQPLVEVLAPSASYSQQRPSWTSLNTLSASAVSLPPCSPPWPLPLLSHVSMIILCQEPRRARGARSPASGTAGVCCVLSWTEASPEAPSVNKLWTEITARPRENSTLWDGKLIFFNFNQHLHENYL